MTALKKRPMFRRNTSDLRVGTAPQEVQKLPFLRPRFSRTRLAPSPLAGLSLARVGNLEARLAGSAAEVKLAQRLRYQVFYEEMSAVADPISALKRRDKDAFDNICDHILVIDHSVKTGRPNRPKVVGTYRLLRQEVAEAHDGFYTASEFDVQPLIDRMPGARFLELGRSCVLAPYRDKRTVELLWQGIWTYVQRHSIDVMFGCASLEGSDLSKLSEPLSFLQNTARAPEEYDVRALPQRYVSMDRIRPEEVNMKSAMRSLPPLIKGYLRLGAYIGDGAVVDHQFGTTDVLVILPVSRISPKYIGYFGAKHRFDERSETSSELN